VQVRAQILGLGHFFLILLDLASGFLRRRSLSLFGASAIAMVGLDAAGYCHCRAPLSEGRWRYAYRLGVLLRKRAVARLCLCLGTVWFLGVHAARCDSQFERCVFWSCVGWQCAGRDVLTVLDEPWIMRALG